MWSGTPPVEEESVLELEGAAGYVVTRTVECESILELESIISWDVAGFVASDLGLSQEIAFQLELSRAQESALNLGQQIGISVSINVAVEHDLGLVDGIVDRYEISKSATNTLNLTGTVTRSVGLEVSHDLDLSGEGLKRDIGESELVLTQSVEWGYGGSVSGALDLVQTIAPNLLLTKVQSHTLGIQQSVAYYISYYWVRQQYNPFIADDSATSPTLNEPMVGIEAPFQLVFPAEGEVTDSVTLRAPNLGNKDRLAFNRVLRETRGGTLIVFADPIWPKIQTHVLSFSALRRSEAQDLLDFLSDYLGQEVGMIDWEQRYWRGIVTVSEEPIIEDSFNSYTASFQFEGELDETWTPQVIPWIPDTPLRRTPLRRDYGPVSPLEPYADPDIKISYAAVSDDSILIGQPVYVKGTGHAGLARASGAAAVVMGFAIVAVGPTETVRFLTEGKITLTDWTAIAGVPALTPGGIYYLDAVTAGRITNVPPSVLGQSVVHVGRAASTLTLDIEVDLSVYL